MLKGRRFGVFFSPSIPRQGEAVLLCFFYVISLNYHAVKEEERIDKGRNKKAHCWPS